MYDLTLKGFAEVVGGELCGDTAEQHLVTNISIDSRVIQRNSVFFPLKGANFDGHQFIADAVNNGAVAAVVERAWLEEHPSSVADFPLVIVGDSLAAMHAITIWWRKQFSGKVIAISGSNGKTVVKDALVRLLSEKYFCAGSPDSFNSQIGVPLSIVRTPRSVHFAVIEAGISQVGEMARLEQIIRPDYGILTNIGLAHISSFNGSREVLAEEKLRLFRNIPEEGWLLTPASDSFSKRAIEALDIKCRVYRFGQPGSDELPFIEKHQIIKDGAAIQVRFPSGDTLKANILTPSREIISNIEIAICAAYLMKVEAQAMERALSDYVPGITRMEIWKSPLGVTLINDACSSDPISVLSSLRTLSSMKNGGHSFFIFGGMRELGNLEAEEHARVGAVAAETDVDTLVLVGEQGVNVTESEFKKLSPHGKVIRSKSPAEVKDMLLPILKWGDTVLLKGPRNTGIDQVARDIMEAMAPSRYYIDLQAIKDNILQFQHTVGPRTRIMAMVKALAYGSDAVRLSTELQRIGVDYFGVASADEGSALRKAGVDRDILVMMCTPDEAEKLVSNGLSAVAYSFDIVPALAEAARKQEEFVDVHIEVDTGMGRLGVKPEEVKRLAMEIAREPYLRLVGLMTHFASADDPAKDEFTRKQIERFEGARNSLREMGIANNLICHAGATAGSVRFAEARYDMVRIGIGMYGIYPSQAVEKIIKLNMAISLVSRVIEIKSMRKGDLIGYGGTYEVQQDDARIGVVPVGYHDGLPLRLSNIGVVLVNGREAPIRGRISMDSMMIDLTSQPEVEEGVDVLIYGRYGGYELRPEMVAGKADTIAYELLARIGPRIQRVYIGQHAT
jgi:Alr-MurF fusion protein